jgi:hypothetical protein
VAHTLANIATRSFMNNMWLNEIPCCIVEIVREREQVCLSDFVLFCLVFFFFFDMSTQE